MTSTRVAEEFMELLKIIRDGTFVGNKDITKEIAKHISENEQIKNDLIKRIRRCRRHEQRY